MKLALPDREAARIRAVEACALLDTPREAQFDRLVFTAAQAFRVPIALFAILAGDRVWIKAGVGPSPHQLSRDLDFHRAVVNQGETLVVQNAATDARFSRLPGVVGAPHVRFYAGAPVRSADRLVVGTFCILDVRPRALPDRFRQQLDGLAREAENHFSNVVV